MNKWLNKEIGRPMGTLIQDVKYGLRMLAKNPGFTAVAVLTLALGIGANSAIFTVVDAVALRTLPVYQPDRLVRLELRTPQGTGEDFSFPDYEDIRQQMKSFAGAAVWYRAATFLNSLDESSQVLVDDVSPDYFTVLGVKPFMGRAFSRELDSTPQTESGVVISYRLWQGRLGADPGIIGKEIKLTGKLARVIGVAPPHFQGLERFVPTDIWILISNAGEFSPSLLQSRDQRDFEAIARLREGVTPAQASPELDLLGQRLAEAYPETNRGTTFQFVPELKHERELLPVGLMLMVAVGFVLLIACANVAGLLLARAESRRHELAMRVALGATRWQLFRQFLTEGLLLSILGALGGLIGASWLMSVQKSLLPPSLRFIGPETRVNLGVVAFTVGVTLLATLVFTITPALRAWKIGLSNVLREELVVRGSRLATRNLLVAGQIALSVMVVTASLLLLRSLSYVRNLPVGFDIHKNLVAVSVFQLQNTGQGGGAFLSRLMERVTGVPGVKRATYALRILLSGSGGGISAGVAIPGVELPENQPSVSINLNAIGLNYFQTMGTRLLRGRDFTSADGPDSARVVIISQTMAHRFWPGGDALGKSIIIDKRKTQIVGIAEDAKISWMRETVKPYMYVPFAQTSYGWGALIVETEGNSDAVVPLLRQEIHRFSPNLVISDVDTPRTLVELSTVDLLMESRLVAALGLLALFLAAIGLYGVVAFVVGKRTHEIGIRVALGARPRQVGHLILIQSLQLSLAGVATGVLAAAGVCRLMATLLYGVKPYDAASFATAPAIVMCVALIASYLPARRATKVDPIVALRYE